MTLQKKSLIILFFNLQCLNNRQKLTIDATFRIIKTIIP